VLLLVVASGMIFQVLDGIDLLFQARGESKLTAWIRMSACIFGSVLKVALILAHAPLVAFAVAGVAELGFAAVGWLWAAWRRDCWITGWSYERARIIGLLRDSWPLAVSGLAISVQAYVDQLVIGAMLGAQELGQYAAAMRLIVVFAFIPMVVQNVAMPEIMRAKYDDETLYQRRLHSLYRLMFGLFLVIGLPLIVLGPLAARALYGVSYTEAAALLPWLAFRLFFTNLGVARSVFIAGEGLLQFALITSVVGAVVNVALNLVLVPQWGVKGAIVSSFASFAVTMFALEVFDRRARANLRLMARAVFFPWRRFAA
jgi:O-antigen/teichoic acid export membrane protein